MITNPWHLIAASSNCGVTALLALKSSAVSATLVWADSHGALLSVTLTLLQVVNLTHLKTISVKPLAVTAVYSLGVWHYNTHDQQPPARLRVFITELGTTLCVNIAYVWVLAFVSLVKTNRHFQWHVHACH